MSASVMKAMLERRNELRDELNALPEFREYELLDGFIRQYESIGHASASDISEVTKRKRRTLKLTIADAAIAALQDAGHPVPLQDLTDALPRYGKTVTGKRPAINLSSALSRDERFESITWHGATAWWFRGREIPPESAGGSAAGGSAADADDASVRGYNAAA